MEKYSFFNAVLTEQGTYDRVYKAEDIAAYFSSFIGNGVYPNPSTNLQIASSNDGMKIYAKPGKAWINGYYYENTENLTFRIDNADAQYDRIDDIVLRLDFLERNITIQIKKGNPAISPAEQALQRDSDIYELKLAKVYVTKGAINITDIDIIDTRQDSEDCGIVAGVVQQINVDDLFLQYNTAFDTWFENVKGQLSEDAAGHLQTEIDEVKQTYAIKNHANSNTLYGVSTNNLYGHVKLSDTPSAYGASSGIAATPKCVQDAVASLSTTKIVLLWTNSRPSNTFGAQKVTLSLSGYHAVLVLGWSYQANAVCSSVFVPVGSKGVITLVGNGTAYRNFTTSTTGVTFEAASVENTATPYKIYGIRL